MKPKNSTQETSQVLAEEVSASHVTMIRDTLPQSLITLCLSGQSCIKSKIKH